MPTNLPVPQRRQTQEADCLTACVAMVLDFLGKPLTYDDLLRRLGTTPYGTVTRNVLRLTRLDLAITYREGTLAELIDLLDHRQPVIVLVKTGELPYWSYSTLHSIVLIGYDETRVYANDPNFQSLQAIPIGDFELAWMEMGNRYIAIALAPQ